MAHGTRVGAVRAVRPAQPEAESQLGLVGEARAQHEVPAAALSLAHPLGSLLGEDPPAVEAAAPGEDAVQGRDGAGGAVAVGRGDLGGPPLRGVGGGRAGARVEQGGDGHRLHPGEEGGLFAGDVLRLDEFGDPVRVLLRQAHREVDPERSGDLLAQELPGQQTGDPADDLADQEAVSDRVVSGAGARLPPGLGGREAGRGELPVVELGQGVRVTQTGDARAVREQVADAHGLLALGGEFGPVGGDRGVQVQESAVGEDVGAERGRALRR